jgi:TM2 domain-containing membrane protein YozV
MNCSYHPEREAVHRCNICGELLCQECSVVLDSKVVCKRCISSAIEKRPEAVYSAPARKTGPAPKRVPSGFLTFIFSVCMPGAGQMYLGYMKRGLFMMSVFFLSIIFTSGLTGYFAFLIPIVYISCFFDAFNLRARIINGEAVEDSISEFTGFLYRYRLPVLIFCVLAAASGMVSKFFDFFEDLTGFSGHGLFSLLLPAAIIGFGIYIFTKGGKKSEYVDKTESYQ